MYIFALKFWCVAESNSKIAEKPICYYPAFNLLCSERYLPGSTQATRKLPSPGSNTLHTSICSPSINFASNIGAIEERLHNIPRWSSYHTCKCYFITPSHSHHSDIFYLDCTGRYSLENGPISMPTLLCHENLYASLEMVNVTNGTSLHSVGMSPLWRNH